MMSFDAFRDTVDLHGADLSRWPAESVQPALLLMENLPAARKYFAAAAETDAALRQHLPELVDLQEVELKIMRRISGSRRPPAERKFFNWRPAYLFAPGGGLVAAALIGFIIGSAPARQPDVLDLFATDQVIGSDAGLYDGEVF